MPASRFPDWPAALAASRALYEQDKEAAEQRHHMRMLYASQHFSVPNPSASGYVFRAHVQHAQEWFFHDPK